MSELNSKEALYGFCGWLTSQDNVVKMGSSEECGGIPDLIECFAKTNNLPEVSDNWHNNLIHPSGECSQVHN